MRRITLCFTFVVLVASAVGQPPPPVVVGQPPVDPTKKEKDKAQAINVMTFPQDRDAKQMLEAVRQYLVEFDKKEDKAPWDKVCFAAQQVLDAKSDSFFELAKKGVDTGKFHGVSAKAEANRLIGQFPPAGKQFYQLAYGPTAENMLKQAIQSGYEKNLLAEVSQRYFHTKAGARATQLLAGVQLNRGNYSEAAYSYERLLARPDADELLTPHILLQAIVSLKRGGGSQTAVIDQLWDRLEKKFPRDGLVIGRKPYLLAQLKEEANRSYETLYGRVGESYASVRYGNASHTAVAEGGPPFLDPSFSVTMTYRTTGIDWQEGATWVNQNLVDVLKGVGPGKLEAVIPGFFPVTTPNLILFRTYDGVYATVTKDGFSNHGDPARAGDVYWYTDANGSLSSMMGWAGSDKELFKGWWNFYRTANQTGILFENPLVGSLSHDGTNVYFVDDHAVPQPPMQNQNDFGMPVAPPSVSTGSRGLGEGSQLKAVHIVTGSRQWTLGEPVPGPPLTDEDEDKTTNPLLLTQGSYFLGPPLAVNGKLYVLVERRGKQRLLCLDPSRVNVYQPKPEGNAAEAGKTAQMYSYPELLWSQRVGEPNTPLPTDTYRRFQCSYLAYADGIVICPTNSGAVVAVDIMSRSLVWAQSYRFVKTPVVDPNQPRGGFRRVQGGANQGLGSSQLTQDRWRAAAPIISQGRVVFAAFDSDAVHCLDLRTGVTIWTEPRKPGDLYVGGLVNDSVVIVGKESVRAVKLVGDAHPNPTLDSPREVVKYAWKDLKIGTPAGHGVTSKGGIYYLPLASVPDSAFPEVWAIDVAAGKVTGRTAYRKKGETPDTKPMLGNLVFHEGQLYSQSATELVAFPLIDLKTEEMNRLLAANPNDPIGLVTRGELLFSKGKYAEAVADLKEAQKHDPPDVLRDRMREKLYQSYTELLKTDFVKYESVLSEYERLCEVPLDSDDPNQRQKLADEQFRRKSLYLSLLGKGREKQGRLDEAFDRYREFAALGGGKQVVTIFDEPNGQTRPDVWARGRIETMIRGAKDPAARKPLETRVAAEWQQVKTANDLIRLREFVRVFGPFFAAGREGQLALAERLIETNNEDDSREAQTLLYQLWATADDKPLAARAVELLARLLTKTGLLEDAVGLYTHLGNDYAEVVVRDGRTGADFFNDLLTDKRLLPFLEPTRLSTPARVKAEVTNGPAAGGVPTGHTFEPEGELLPFYRRYRLSLSNESNNGTWTLRLTDRTNGAERCKFDSLRLYTPNGAPPYRLGYANGHLLLLHLGHMAYCFDLAEKKKLWEYNLLGANSRADTNNVQPDMGADGEMTISFLPEGFKIRLGRSSILEPNYACLLTRDGLTALDPATSAVLWTRTNISLTAHVFGDAKHVFIVEPAEGGGKAKSRVLRAVDGTVVEGVPEFGPLFASKARVKVLGRLVLLNEGGGEKPRVVRLYDPLAGADVWRKEYPPRSLWTHVETGDAVCVFQPDGKFEVSDTRTGKTSFAGTIDGFTAERFSALGTPTLLNDADRYYLVLNRDQQQTQNYANYYGNYTALRTVTLTGPVHCFDRTTGKRLWFTETLLDNQSVILERFAENPGLIAATTTNEDGSGIPVYRVVVVDKRNGKVRYLKGLTQTQTFYSLAADMRNGTVRLYRGDLHLTVGPDDSAKPTTK